MRDALTVDTFVCITMESYTPVQQKAPPSIQSRKTCASESAGQFIPTAVLILSCSARHDTVHRHMRSLWLQIASLMMRERPDNVSPRFVPGPQICTSLTSNSVYPCCGCATPPFAFVPPCLGTQPTNPTPQENPSCNDADRFPPGHSFPFLPAFQYNQSASSQPFAYMQGPRSGICSRIALAAKTIPLTSHSRSAGHLQPTPCTYCRTPIPVTFTRCTHTVVLGFT